MKKLNNMVIVERKIVNGTQSKGRIDVNFTTKRQCMPIERATKLKQEDELMVQENDSVSLFEILGDAYQVDVKVGNKTISKILLLEEIEDENQAKETKVLKIEEQKKAGKTVKPKEEKEKQTKKPKEEKPNKSEISEKVSEKLD